MINKEQVSLIDGEFSVEEIKEILLNMYNSKIQFHQLKNFSSKERFGKEDAIAVKRLPELEKSRQKLIAIFEKASHNQGSLKIKSYIELEFNN